jgi:hypothetical protein
MSLQIEGKLFKVYPTEQKTDKFQSRDFAIEFMSGNYPQLVKFQLSNDKCDLIDAYQIGSQVRVYFDLRGREWNDKILTNLQAWKIESLEQDPPQQPVAQEVSPQKAAKIEDAILVPSKLEYAILVPDKVDDLPF